MKRLTKRRALAALAGAAAVAAVAGAASAQQSPGFRTTQPSQLQALKPGVTITPLITVGDRIGPYTFESIPDGIAIRTVGKGKGRKGVAFVNHETSLVPFPFDPRTGVGQSDFTNSILSRLVITPDARIRSGAYAIPSEANYQRFCSNFIAGKEHGFERPILFTNEEATDVVYRTGTAFPVSSSDPRKAEQAGLVVGYDILTGKYRPLYSMGRHNHENAVAIPGYGKPVILSGDDTFTAPSSQMYLYLSRNAATVMKDQGALYGFRSDDPNVNDYSDMSGTQTVSGRFIRVPVEIAKGDQTALESWSNQNNVFQFIRVEDIAYDRRTPNVVYFADTGEPRALPGPGGDRMRRGASGTNGPFPNGRIFRMELDRKNPLVVRSLSILINGDSQPAKNASVIHNPDNIETTRNSLLIQEDPGSHNQYAPGEPGGTNARIWRYDLRTGAMEVVAAANQAPYDSAARLGNWETSGIVDASAMFGPETFLTTVQAHSVLVNSEQRGPLLFKRESGQLLLLRIPGA